MPTEREVSIGQFRAHVAALPKGRRIDEVVVHHTWSPTVEQYRGIETVRGVRRYHMEVRGWSDNGYHVMVGPDGKVFLCRPITVSGAHVLNRNAHTIGVCLIGDYDATDPTSVRGYPVLLDVLRALLDRYDLSPGNIRFHREFADKSCPGRKFSLARLRRDVSDVNTPTPEYDQWAAEGVQWAQRTGVMTGREGGFAGREPVTRQELAVALLRLWRLLTTEPGK